MADESTDEMKNAVLGLGATLGICIKACPFGGKPDSKR